MADYRIQDARFTAIFVRKPQAGGTDLYERVPFELVRFNVDVDPDAPAFIMPIGERIVQGSGIKPDSPKIYEKIWITDTVPWRPGADGKVWFGNITA